MPFNLFHTLGEDALWVFYSFFCILICILIFSCLTCTVLCVVERFPSGGNKVPHLILSLYARTEAHMLRLKQCPPTEEMALSPTKGRASFHESPINNHLAWTLSTHPSRTVITARLDHWSPTPAVPLQPLQHALPSSTTPPISNAS